MQNGNDCLGDSHLKGPDIRPVGDRELVCLPPHALFDLYFAHSTSSLFKLIMTMTVAGESFLGGKNRNVIPMPASCLVDRGVRIVKYFDPGQSMEFNQRSTSADPSNMQS